MNRLQRIVCRAIGLGALAGRAHMLLTRDEVQVEIASWMYALLEGVDHGVERWKQDQSPHTESLGED